MNIGSIFRHVGYRFQSPAYARLPAGLRIVYKRPMNGLWSDLNCSATFGCQFFTHDCLKLTLLLQKRIQFDCAEEDFSYFCKQEVFIAMKYKDFEDAISPERMHRYVSACANNTKRAMTLYRYNLRLSQEMYAISLPPPHSFNMTMLSCLTH